MNGRSIKSEQQPVTVAGCEQIEIAMMAVDEATDRLSDMLSHLEKRLNRVMRPSNEMCCEATCDPRPVMSPLGYSLMNHADRLNGYGSRIAEFMSRLET